MEIIQKDEDIEGAFIAIDGSEEAGFLTYTWTSSIKFIIEQIHVAPEFEAKEVAMQLLLPAVVYARANNLKIMPFCPLAKSMFYEHTAIADVLF